MLEELRIRGLGVIDDATVGLHPGLTVVTGETGAGKTMVVAGLALLAGARGDPGLVRQGCGRAVVEGRFRPCAEALTGLVGVGPAGDGALLVSRSLGGGRSRASVAGRPVSLAALAELGGRLIGVSGQSAQYRLLRPAVQRAALDRYAGRGVAQLLARYAEAWRAVRSVEAELVGLTGRAVERAAEADGLRVALEEIAAVEPLAGEDVRLRAEAVRLENVEALRVAAGSAHMLLAGDPGDGSDPAPPVRDLLALVGRALDGVRGADAALDEAAARAEELTAQAGELATDLARYVDGLDASPARLAAVLERRARLTALLRGRAADVDGLLAWGDGAQRRLAELDGDAERIPELLVRHRDLQERAAALAADLSDRRRSAAARLAGLIDAGLAALAMPQAGVTVEVTGVEVPGGEVPGGEVPGVVGPCALPVGGRCLAAGPTGVDDVEIVLRAHPGAPARPLARGASGGELSRVLLALEVVLAGSDGVPTLVFDEVDAGVGGRAAVEVGRMLARLARDRQVVAVTHLPQVAAFADRHVTVSRGRDGRVTGADIAPVEGERRVQELARMLAGFDGSELALGHARELLRTAERERTRGRGGGAAPGPRARHAGRAAGGRRCRGEGARLPA